MVGGGVYRGTNVYIAEPVSRTKGGDEKSQNSSFTIMYGNGRPTKIWERIIIAVLSGYSDSWTMYMSRRWS